MGTTPAQLPDFRPEVLAGVESSLTSSFSENVEEGSPRMLKRPRTGWVLVA